MDSTSEVIQEVEYENDEYSSLQQLKGRFGV
jgi:hypothetical protein